MYKNREIPNQTGITIGTAQHQISIKNVLGC
jgi:hypothetical protein